MKTNQKIIYGPYGPDSHTTNKTMSFYYQKAEAFVNIFSVPRTDSWFENADQKQKVFDFIKKQLAYTMHAQAHEWELIIKLDWLLSFPYMVPFLKGKLFESIRDSKKNIDFFIKIYEKILITRSIAGNHYTKDIIKRIIACFRQIDSYFQETNQKSDSDIKNLCITNWKRFLSLEKIRIISWDQLSEFYDQWLLCFTKYNQQIQWRNGMVLSKVFKRDNYKFLEFCKIYFHIKLAYKNHLSSVVELKPSDSDKMWSSLFINPIDKLQFLESIAATSPELKQDYQELKQKYNQ